MAVSANRLELLQIADAVAREKSIDRMIVVTAMEDAIQKAARSRYGQETDVRAEINPKTGEIKLQRLLKVVEQIDNMATDILVEDARRRNPAAQPGDFIAEPLPPMDFGRIAAQSAKQVIVQKVREAERDRQYEEFKDRIGEIVNGQVKRVEYGNVIVDLGRGEGIVRRDELIPRETFRYGDRIRAYIYDVRREQRGPQIFLSRTHPQFMTKLFAQEVPEIYDGIIEVRSVARDPGSRAKIAVISRDSSIDPVGACVGMRGSRVQAVVNELQGEKIDIIPWSGDAATFIVNALQPAEVAKVVLDEDAERIEVVVPDDQLSLAIGRRGQNVRLASQLTGWDIDILTEQEESERRQKEFQERSALFISALDVDEVVGQLLASEGFASVDEIAFIELDDLSSIEGFDDDTAGELQARARDYLARIEAEQDEERKALGVEDALKEIPGVNTAALVALGKAEIRTVEDFAGLVPDDIVGYVERKDGETTRTPGALDGFDVSRADAEAMIMQARIKAGWITQEDLDRAAAEAAAAAAEAEAAAEAAPATAPASA
jgi:N utilization substance protein A